MLKQQHTANICHSHKNKKINQKNQSKCHGNQQYRSSVMKHHAKEDCMALECGALCDLTYQCKNIKTLSETKMKNINKMQNIGHNPVLYPQSKSPIIHRSIASYGSY